MLTIILNLIFSDPRETKVYCRWGSWTASECSLTCGGGTRIKSRTKLINEVGTFCDGEDTIKEPCNPAECEDKYSLLVNFH